jgi:acyl-CoA reductase-like NAD-dependent aldehyde dehydrogenase
MRQLELLIVQVRLRVREEPAGGNMTWNELPARARAEVIEHLAKMLRAKLERSAAAEVRDE